MRKIEYLTFEISFVIFWIFRMAGSVVAYSVLLFTRQGSSRQIHSV